MHLRSTKSIIFKRGNCFGKGSVVIIALVVLLSFEAWAGTATDLLKGTLDRIIKVLNDPSLKTPDKKNERTEKLFKLIKERFDEEEFSRKVLGAHWRERTKEEKQEFVKVFSDLLERTYVGKIDAYVLKAGNFSGDNILYLKESVKGKYAIVATKVIIGKDSEIPVHYRFINKEGDWLVCDIAIEGVSFVKNYRAQFSEILANSSYKDLIAKLKAKQEPENKTRGEKQGKQ